MFLSQRSLRNVTSTRGSIRRAEVNKPNWLSRRMVDPLYQLVSNGTHLPRTLPRYMDSPYFRQGINTRTARQTTKINDNIEHRPLGYIVR